MGRILKQALMVASLAAVVAAAIAVAAPDGDSGGDRPRGERGMRQAHNRLLAGAAEDLGVSRAQLRAALRDAREAVGPPARPEGDDTIDELEQRMEEHCRKVTDAVGEELSVEGDRVREAFESAAKERIEQARENGRISEEEAEQALSRLEDKDCVLLGPGFIHRAGPGGPGCGPGGPGGPGGPHAMPPPA
jgi:uncharacterized protein (DUF2126 family)